MKPRSTLSTLPMRPPGRHWLHRMVSWLAENVAFVSWYRHWKGVYLHCVHPRYCVRLYLWGCDWHKKARYALEKPANDRISDAQEKV